MKKIEGIIRSGKLESLQIEVPSIKPFRSGREHGMMRLFEICFR